MDRLHDPYGTLTPTQRRLIATIHNTGDWLDTTAAAQSVGIVVSTANRILNELADGGTVERRKSPRVNRGKPAYQWKCAH
jgi:predicted transcriptional regulator